MDNAEEFLDEYLAYLSVSSVGTKGISEIPENVTEYIYILTPYDAVETML